jgi:hypothetical protein
MKRNPFAIFGGFLLLAMIASQPGQADESKKEEWKAQQLKCLTAPAPKGGGLSAADATTAQSAAETCHHQAKEAGKGGWKEAFEKCISSQPENLQAALKKCRPPMHGHKGENGNPSDGE